MKTRLILTGSIMLVFSMIIFAFVDAPVSDYSGSSDQDGWVSLFNGKNLNGWNLKEGRTKFTVEENQIVGTTIKQNPNSVLCTAKEYGNFILELDVKVDSPLNSGIQVRSHLNKKGEVYGAQIEVDPSKRRWSGGIYDCRRRGWMVPPIGDPIKQNAFKNNQWNHFRIKFNKDTLQSWINGVTIATLIDINSDKKGWIGLQADGNKKEGLQVRFKNIKIKEL